MEAPLPKLVTNGPPLWDGGSSLLETTAPEAALVADPTLCKDTDRVWLTAADDRLSSAKQLCVCRDRSVMGTPVISWK